MRAAGPWPWRSALVTGASSGIGEALVRRLAAGGVAEVVVVARRRDRLDALAASLAPATRAEVLVADLATDAGSAAVADRLAAGPPVDLVVNDAGQAWSAPYLEGTEAVDDGLVRLNVLALTRLTRAGLAPMVGRGRGAVLNVSSMVAYQPTPGSAVYAATKAYVVHLSEALHEELRGTGVTVTALLPGFTRTAMVTGRVPPGLWLEPDAVARAGLVAAARGRALCVPGAPYKTAAAVVTPLPRTARRWLMGRLAGTLS